MLPTRRPRPRPTTPPPVVTMYLSADDSAAWEAGGWLSLEIQESMLEAIERQRIPGVVAVCLADTTVIFWVSAAREVHRV